MASRKRTRIMPRLPLMIKLDSMTGVSSGWCSQAGGAREGGEGRTGE